MGLPQLSATCYFKLSNVLSSFTTLANAGNVPHNSLVRRFIKTGVFWAILWITFSSDKSNPNDWQSWTNLIVLSISLLKCVSNCFCSACCISCLFKILTPFYLYAKPKRVWLVSFLPYKGITNCILVVFV